MGGQGRGRLGREPVGRRSEFWEKRRRKGDGGRRRHLVDGEQGCALIHRQVLLRLRVKSVSLGEDQKSRAWGIAVWAAGFKVEPAKETRARGSHFDALATHLLQLTLTHPGSHCLTLPHLAITRSRGEEGDKSAPRKVRQDERNAEMALDLLAKAEHRHRFWR